MGQPDDAGKSREQLLEDRRLAEQALHERAAQMQAVITAAVDGILAIDERGTILWLNPAALRIFGYSADELIGKNVNILMPEPDRSQHDQYLRNYLETGQRKINGIGREVLGRRKDGSIFPLDLAVSEAKLDGRRLFTGIVRDISQRKDAERALVEAKESAEAANRAKDQFLAIVSHELRTPLNPILTAVSYLESRADIPHDLYEEISAIRRNVEHEARLVDDLLNLTRLARGKVELHHEAVDVHTLLRQCLRDTEDQIDARDIELTRALRAREFIIWADPARMRQVLINLIGNAVKFTDPGGRIAVRTTNPRKDRLSIEIIDTGIGIEPDMLHRLFTPFEQGERTISRKYGGLGLGLAISKAIVDLHGGKLCARSEGRGKGATFVLEMATVMLEDIPAAPVQQAGPGARKVLLVEDHRDTLRIMDKLLRAMGYHVTTAMSVADALRLIDAEPFDILVSDIGLPDGTGLDIMHSIRNKRPIKAIAVSGFSQPEDISRSREAGFADHLIKPVNYHQLEVAMQHVAV